MIYLDILFVPNLQCGVNGTSLELLIKSLNLLSNKLLIQKTFLTRANTGTVNIFCMT